MFYLLIVTGALVIFYINMMFAVAIHEIGHAVTGYLLGLKPKIIVIGGFLKPRLRFKIKKINCSLFFSPLPQIAMVRFVKQETLTGRFFIMTLAGPFVNVLLLILFLFLFKKSVGSLNWWSIFVVSGITVNFGFGPMQLIPLTGSDGLHLLRCLIYFLLTKLLRLLQK